MLQDIITGSATTEQNVTTFETDAHAAYEAFVKDTTNAITANQKGITSDKRERRGGSAP